jgi:DNA-binding Lrp family transcriptional regulator
MKDYPDIKILAYMVNNVVSSIEDFDANLGLKKREVRTAVRRLLKNGSITYQSSDMLIITGIGASQFYNWNAKVLEILNIVKSPSISFKFGEEDYYSSDSLPITIIYSMGEV